MKIQRMQLETRRPASPMVVFPPRRDYASLSLRDLLDAREAYHVHLSSIEEVSATAIGRYLIHEDDWYAKHPPGSRRPAGAGRPKSARTLANTVLRPWSWPCVIVFVKEWKQPAQLGENEIPRTLYLPDGRVVPVCVVEATPDETESAEPPRFPTTSLVGGGYSCLRAHQGIESYGTFACLVRKGGSFYALTNRHVAGGSGEVVQAWMRGRYQRVGVTSGFALDRLPIPGVFPAWHYPKSLLTLDAGLVRVDDVNDWTSQAFGIGEIGEMFDATEASLTLDLIGTPVRSYNAVSGSSAGEIRALFFRYESAGGFDHMTDLFIAPRRGAKGNAGGRPFTRPGDSGTLWFYDRDADEEVADANRDLHQPPAPAPEEGERAPRLRPVAMQWGGQQVRLPGGRGSYALATFLSSICRALDVELERDWSLGHEQYWGKIGHFSIGWKACDRVTGALGTLMKNNQPRIGFGDDHLSHTFTLDPSKDFVPLADVPDFIWTQSRGANEGPQHFADVDIVDIDGQPPLLDRCHQDPKQIAASVWNAYFEGFRSHHVGPDYGALPFRVWQIFDAMVAAVGKPDVPHFVAAAGVLAHYVGDASQPLHCSYLHHGVPPMTTFQGRSYPQPKSTDAYQAFKASARAQIHGIYEEKMLEVDPAGALKLVDQKIQSMSAPALPAKATGHDAAVQVIRLMHDSRARLAPMDIINADDPTLTPMQRATRLWNVPAIRDATVTSLADSVVTLAAIWKAAWKTGGGDAIPQTKLAAIAPAVLAKICRTEKTFVPSLSLKAMAASKKFEP